MLSSHIHLNQYDAMPPSLLATVIDMTEQQQVNVTYSMFEKHLNANNKALSYLINDRGIKREIINQFSLGYASLPICKDFKAVDNPEALTGLLKRTGIVGPKGHHIFLGSVIFPVKQHGHVVGGMGRRISDVVRHTSTPYPFHLIDESALFNTECLIEQPNCVVLCKSPLEALSAVGQGIENIISLVGYCDFNESHAKLLKSHRVKVVKVAFNQSSYYLHKVSAIAQLLNKYRIRCKVVELNDWQDINALTLYDPSGKTLRQRLRQAQLYGGH